MQLLDHGLSNRLPCCPTVKPHIAIIVFFITTALSAGARCDVPEASRHEVLHLLEFIRNSDCMIERNGQRYDGENAYSHVKRKYDYFRDEIKTSESFIEFSASRSTMSGEFYLVLCGNGSAMRTQEWLLEELRNYRADNR